MWFSYATIAGIDVAEDRESIEKDGDWIAVCNVNELQQDGFRSVQGRYELITVYFDSGNYYATSGRCMHDWSTPLGDYVANGVVTCPRHGAQYCLRTGRHLIGPATSNLGVYVVRIEEEQVWVRSTSNPR